MSQTTIWWLIAGALVVLELLSGTFYLLMLALGAAVAALAATAGISATAQMLTAALVGGGAVVTWHQWRAKAYPKRPAQANPDVNLDIGEIVQIANWNPDGTATVHYRGAGWTAVHRQGVSASPGAHRVSEVIGNRLVVDRI